MKLCNKNTNNSTFWKLFNYKTDFLDLFSHFFAAF